MDPEIALKTGPGVHGQDRAAGVHITVIGQTPAEVDRIIPATIIRTVEVPLMNIDVQVLLVKEDRTILALDMEDGQIMKQIAATADTRGHTRQQANTGVTMELRKENILKNAEEWIGETKELRVQQPMTRCVSPDASVIHA